MHTTTPSISTKNPFVYFSQFSSRYYILTIPTNTPFLYTSAIFHLYFCVQPSQQSTPKIRYLLQSMPDSLQSGSCSLPYLCIQPHFQSPPKIRSSTSANFRLHITSLKSPRPLPSSIPQQFFISIFGDNHPDNLHQKYFPYLSHLAN